MLLLTSQEDAVANESRNADCCKRSHYCIVRQKCVQLGWMHIPSSKEDQTYIFVLGAQHEKVQSTHQPEANQKQTVLILPGLYNQLILRLIFI